LNQDFILFERQVDGKYKRTGELPKNTRYATVVNSSQPNGGGLHTVKRVNQWLEILSEGPLKHEWYKVVPADNPKPMSDEAKEKLRELNRQKKEQVHVEEET
jgi:hypothetical protein